MHLQSNFYRISEIDVLILDDPFSPGRLRMGDFRMTFSSYHACSSVPTPLACLLSSGNRSQSFCVTNATAVFVRLCTVVLLDMYLFVGIYP